RGIGVGSPEEAGARLFPDSNRARDVLDALLRETRRVGAIVTAGTRVHDVVPLAGDNGFQIATSDGRLLADRVVLATGGRALPKNGSGGRGYEIAPRPGHGNRRPNPPPVPPPRPGAQPGAPPHPGGP